MVNDMEKDNLYLQMVQFMMANGKMVNKLGKLCLIRILYFFFGLLFITLLVVVYINLDLIPNGMVMFMK